MASPTPFLHIHERRLESPTERLKSDRSGTIEPHSLFQSLMSATDTLGRSVRDLRISVTDRCNFRCTYCMPRDVFGRDYPFLPREALLSYEEIARLARAFATLGVKKIRLTGGEPTLRRDLHVLVGMLAGIDGIEDLALTTNGSILDESMIERFSGAGLSRITISLDALDDRIFRQLNDVDFAVQRVLDSIDLVAASPLGPLKIDAVIRRGINESQILPLAERFRATPHVLRFIEFMDVGTTNAWRAEEVVSGREILEIIRGVWPLEPLPPLASGEVARRWRYVDGGGEIGVITSVSEPFCGSCTRARLTADGTMWLCLFASQGHDLRSLVRTGASDEELAARIAAIWSARDDRYSQRRSESSKAPPRKIEMSRVGG